MCVGNCDAVDSKLVVVQAAPIERMVIDEMLAKGDAAPGPAGVGFPVLVVFGTARRRPKIQQRWLMTSRLAFLSF